MKKKLLFVSILALSLGSGLLAEGFQFENTLKCPIKIIVEAGLKNGTKEKNSVELKPGTVYTREDYNEVTDLKVSTLKKDAKFLIRFMIFWDKLMNKKPKSYKIKELNGHWKERMQGAEKGKMKRIRFYEADKKLKIRSNQLKWNDNTCPDGTCLTK